MGRGFGSDHLRPAPAVGRWRAAEVEAGSGELDHRLVVVEGERDRHSVDVLVGIGGRVDVGVTVFDGVAGHFANGQDEAIDVIAS